MLKRVALLAAVVGTMACLGAGQARAGDGKFVLEGGFHYDFLVENFARNYEPGPGADLFLGYRLTDWMRLGLLSRFAYHESKHESYGLDDGYRLAFNFHMEFQYTMDIGFCVGGRLGLGLGYADLYYFGAYDNNYIYTRKNYELGISVLAGFQMGWMILDWLQINAFVDVDFLAKDLGDNDYDTDDDPSFVEVMFPVGLNITFLF